MLLTFCNSGIYTPILYGSIRKNPDYGGFLNQPDLYYLLERAKKSDICINRIWNASRSYIRVKKYIFLMTELTLFFYPYPVQRTPSNRSTALMWKTRFFVFPFKIWRKKIGLVLKSLNLCYVMYLLYHISTVKTK